MNQIATTQSSTRTNQGSSHSLMEKHTLHPVLQNVLASLDVQIEEELIRYRRQRGLSQSSASYGRNVARRQTQRGLDLITPPRDRATPAAPPTESDLPAAQFHPTDTLPPLAGIPETPAIGHPSPSAAELRQLAEQYASQVAATDDLHTPRSESPDDYLESSEELLRTLSQEEAQVQAEQGFMQSLLTPLGLGSMLLLLMSSALFGFVIMNPDSVAQLFANRGDQQAQTLPPPSNGSSGDGAASSTAVSSPHLNVTEQEFPELQLGNLGSIPATDTPSAGQIKLPASVKPPQQTPSGLTVTDPTGSSNQAKVPSQPLPTGPAVSPAGDMPSSRTLAPSTAPAAPTRSYNPPPPARSYEPPAPKRRYSSPSPSPVRSYEPPAPKRSYSPPPARRYDPPAPKRSYTPPPPIQPYTPPSASTLKSPAKAKPSPSPTIHHTPLSSPSPAPATNTAKAGSGYKVVVPYTSDRALEDYRKQNPDAYVKNYSDGAKVQFGAYQDEASAQSQAEELRKQGVPAQVYKP